MCDDGKNRCRRVEGPVAGHPECANRVCDCTKCVKDKRNKLLQKSEWIDKEGPKAGEGPKKRRGKAKRRRRCKSCNGIVCPMCEDKKYRCPLKEWPVFGK